MCIVSDCHHQKNPLQKTDSIKSQTGKINENREGRKKNVEGEGFEPSKPKQRIYSPSHLTALEPLQHYAVLN